MKRFKVTYLFLALLMFLSSFAVTQSMVINENIQLLTTKNTFEADETITLQFSSKTDSGTPLYCSNSYGSTLIYASFENNILSYTIPSIISEKAGMVNWNLFNKTNSLSGQFSIRPKKSVKTMETYLGPPSINAGRTDYTMLVVIPTDTFDNPVKDNTLVKVKHQFLASEIKEDVFTKNLIAYKNIYSPNKTGRIIIASESLGTNSNEFDVNVMPAIPTNFAIFSERPHDYADGNQITTFSTSIITDNYNNTVADGTYVEFYITTKEDNILKTSGTTIDGIATAKMIHPDHESDWVIKAFIHGIAESNTINIGYKSAIRDFEVTFSQNNRVIVIGPLQSFMDQMIPDGLQIDLKLYKDEEPVNTLIKYSNQGFATFRLNHAVYKGDTYSVSIKTAGTEKTFQNIKLW